MESPLASDHRKRDNYVDGEAVYVTGPLAVLLRLSRWTGVAPLQMRRVRAGWRIMVSPPLATLHRVLMTLLNMTLVTGVILDFYQEHRSRVRVGVTFMNAFIWLADNVLVMLIASIAVYAGPAKMESLKQVLKQLQKIKSDLNTINPPAKTEKIKSIALVGLVIWTVTVTFMDFYLYLRRCFKDDSMCIIMCLYGAYYVANLQGAFVVLQWCCATLAVRAAAAALNENLLRLRHAHLMPEPITKLEDIPSSPKSISTLVGSITLQAETTAKQSVGTEFSTYPSQAQAMIRRLVFSYERLSETIREMNDANGWVVMAILTSTSLRLVLTPYYMLKELFSSELDYLFGIILPLHWCVAHMTTLILTIEPCHRTQVQRERTEVLLSQLIVHLAPKCERLSKELDQFTKQLLLNNAKFMPLGVYTLARPLMATILGGVTTYLVIIIQFQMVSNQL